MRLLTALPVLTLAATIAAQDLPTPKPCDLNTRRQFVSSSSAPDSYAGLDNGMCVFAATTPITGRELFLTNGTDETDLLKDLNPGSASSNPERLTSNGKKVALVADGAGLRHALWITDGIFTEKVREFREIRGPIVPYQGDFYFAADDGTGLELWRTVGGSTARAILAKPDGSGGDPRSFTVFQGELYVSLLGFDANGDSVGFELFAWNGSRLRLVDDTLPNSGIAASDLTAVDFGTAAQPKPWLIFSAADRLGGRELWGMPAGGKPRRLADLQQGTLSSVPSDFTVSRLTNRPDLVFFLARVRSPQLFVLSDPNALPTQLFLGTDPRPGELVAVPDVTLGKHRIFFVARTPQTGEEVWVSGGSNANTRIVRDLNGPQTGAPRDLTLLPLANKNLLVFRAITPLEGDEPWVSDGTVAGTFPLELTRGRLGSFPRGLGTCGDRVFFGADVGSIGLELYATRGTTETTKLIADIAKAPRSGTRDSNPGELCRGPTGTWFAADIDGKGRELVVKDEDGSHVIDNNPGAASSNPEHITPTDNGVFFSDEEAGVTSLSYQRDRRSKRLKLRRLVKRLGRMRRFRRGVLAACAVDSNVGTEPYFVTSDGSTTLLGDLTPGAGDTEVGPFSVSRDGRRAFFCARSANRCALWRTDGTRAGTRKVDMPASVQDVLHCQAFKKGCLFSYRSQSNGVEPGYNDGTRTQLWDLFPGAQSSNPTCFAAARKFAIFGARTGTCGKRIFRFDGSTTRRVTTKCFRELRVPCSGGYWRKRVPICADDGTSGAEPWATDGENAWLLADLNPGPRGSNPERFTKTSINTCAFRAETAKRGVCAYVSNLRKVRAVPDLVPGKASSMPDSFSADGRTLRFVATRADVGREVFEVSLDSVAVALGVGGNCGVSGPQASAGSPVSGTQVDLEVFGGPANGASILMFGRQSAPWGLPFLGVDCSAFLMPFVFVPMALDANGEATRQMPLPNRSGDVATLQALTMDQAGFTGLTNAVVLFVRSAF